MTHICIPKMMEVHFKPTFINFGMKYTEL